MSKPQTRQSLHSAVAQIALLVVPLLLFPVSLLALFYNYAGLILCPQNTFRRHVRRSSRFRPQKVVITGISTPVGLRVARALHYTGHDVIGVNEGGLSILNHARWSNAVSKFYSIRSSRPGKIPAYTEDILKIVVKEKARLWIDCGVQASTQPQAEAKRVIEKATACTCLVTDVKEIGHFASRDDFHRLLQRLGMPTPEQHSVGTRNDIHNVLTKSNGTKFILSSPNEVGRPTVRTILPRRTVSQTYQDVAQMQFIKSNPWKLEQYLEDLPRFTVCAIIVHGKLRAFAASSVTDKEDCKNVPVSSGLNKAMRQYVEDLASGIGGHLSTHLTIEFCLSEKHTSSGVVQEILPWNGRLTSHETLLLFGGKKGSIDLTKAYISSLASTANGLSSYTGLPYSDSSSDVLVPTEADYGVYFLYRDLRTLFVEPSLALVLLRSTLLSTVRIWLVFVNHLVSWQEAVYDFGDPFPLFWYTYVNVPSMLVSELLWRIMSRFSSKYQATEVSLR